MQLKRKGDRHDDVTTSKNLVGLQAKQYQYCEPVRVCISWKRGENMSVVRKYENNCSVGIISFN